MRHQDYVVKLGAKERQWLEALAKTGKSSARMQIRARILLHADVSKAGSKWSDQRIAAALGCCEALCQRVRKRYAAAGLATAVARKKRETPPVPLIFDGEQEAKLITLACSPPPAGHKRWSLRLLENQVVELHIVDHASDNTIGRVLKKTNLSRISKRKGSFRRNKTALS